MEKIVFTNGCFDLLHPGHIDLLERAKALGTRLIVGINSDASVRAIKGHDRPIQSQEERREILLGLRSVDEVVIFDECTPENIIKSIKPDVLVKGGDWKPNEIVGADFVIGVGGEVHSLPLKEGFSSTKLIEKMGTRNGNSEIAVGGGVAGALQEHLQVFSSLAEKCSEQIEQCAALIFDTFATGGKLLICGNGGSAADSQHLAAEFVGRYENERRALPALALTTDTSAITALANDYDFERIFARQVEALATEGDCLIAISTSGNSPNVIAAVMAARKKGCRVIGLTGISGKKLSSLCEHSVMVPSARTSRIQEAHIAIAHIWSEYVDSKLAAEKEN
jgi:D-sedoheptulose 7-phosphate isomerase